MNVERRSTGDLEVLALSGVMDAAQAPQVRQALREALDAGRKRLLVDLAGVTFMDSSALFALVSTYKAARSLGGDVALSSLCPSVRALFELTRLHRVFEIFDDQATAVARLGAAS